MTDKKSPAGTLLAGDFFVLDLNNSPLYIKSYLKSA